MNNQNPVTFGFNEQSKIMEEVMMNGNIPVAAPGRFGMMSGGGGVVPPTMLDESLVPKFYQDAIAACGATQQNMLPHTGLVYNLMVTSGLPRSVLSYVWSAVNRTLPGQLTRPEFFSCLALIALAQFKLVLILYYQFIFDLLLFFFKANMEQEYIVQKPRLVNDLDEGWSNTSSFNSIATLTSSKQLLASSPSISSCQSTDLNRPSVDSKESISNTMTKDVVASSSKNTQERTGYWRQIIAAAISIFNTAESVFSRASDEVLYELIETERGDGYLRSLHRLYLVIKRVERSAGLYLSQDNKHQLKECQRIWMKLSSFLEDLETEEVSSLENK
uniref:EH domain-containing protein n=1 Tax=Heterorhabditis bacteriophora TaxID=37862 RepID=A0A1I7XBC4_HETBA